MSTDTTPKPDGDGATSEQVVSRTELTTAIERRDRALERARAAEAKATELESKVADFETRFAEVTRKNSKENNNVSELEESYKAELAKREKAITDLQKELEAEVIDRQVLSMAEKELKHPDLFLQIHRDKFEVGRDEKGSRYVKVKNSAQTLDEIIRDFGEARPDLKKATLKPGAGTTGVDGAKAPKTLADLAQMSRVDRVKALKADKELRKAVKAG